MSLDPRIIKIKNESQSIKTTIYTIPRTEIADLSILPCAQPTETLQKFYSRTKSAADLVINGGFFDTSNGNSCFNLVSNREVVHSTSGYQWGIGIFENNELKYGPLNKMDNPKHFISGYPNLVDNFKPCDITFGLEVNYRAARTVIGFSERFFYFIFFESAIYSEMQKFLVEVLKIQYAINLDGGGSSRCLENGVQTIGTEWSRPVDNVVTLTLKPKAVEPPTPPVVEPKFIYRVQVGAFGVEQNAINLRDKLRKDGYPDAFIAKSQIQ